MSRPEQLLRMAGITGSSLDNVPQQTAHAADGQRPAAHAVDAQMAALASVLGVIQQNQQQNQQVSDFTDALQMQQLIKMLGQYSGPCQGETDPKTAGMMKEAFGLAVNEILGAVGMMKYVRG